MMSSFKNMEIFAANIAILFTFRIREFITCPNKIPCVFPVFWQNLQIPCVFPDRDFFGHFPCFPCAVGTLPIVLPGYMYKNLQGNYCR